MSYRYLNIKYFHDDKEENVKYANDITELENICRSTNKECIYESLNSNVRRFYVDIDKIPQNNTELIFDIITALMLFFKFPKSMKYALTKNNLSKDNYYSYHLYFPMKIDKINLRNGLCKFLRYHQSYLDYIDVAVYTRDIQLMRLPWSHSALKTSISKGLPIEYNYNEDDYHEIIKGEFKDCVIQNIDELPEFKTQYKDMKAKTLAKYKISTKNWLINNNVPIENNVEKDN